VIRHYVRQFRRQLAIAAALSATAGGASILLLAHLNRLAVQTVFGGPAAVLEGLLLVAAMVATQVLSQTVSARLSADIVARLRTELSQWFAALDYEKVFRDKHLVTTVLISDVLQLVRLLLLFPMVLFNGTMTLFGLTYLGIISWKLLIVFGGILAIAAASTALFMKRTKATFTALRQAEETLFQAFHGIADGKKELTLSKARAEHFVGVVIRDAIEASRRLAFVAHRWWAYGESLSIGLSFGAVFLVIYAGRGLLDESPATIMQFVIAALFVIGPVHLLVHTGREAGAGRASIRRIEEIGITPWQREPEAPRTGEAHSPFAGWTEINARGLSYLYPGEEEERSFALGPIDLTIRRGETVFVVGGNGSGKSTLMLLLAGLVRPGGGAIDVDGRTVGEKALGEYRALFTGVFADFHLFRHVVDRTGSVAADETVNTWLERLDLHRKVRSAGGVLSTLELSQGQRKRLALAQCYVDDSDVYVFDEWAADQDPEFRAFFYSELLSELKQRGKTVVVVTHDERYFALADRLIRLENGGVAAASVHPLEPLPANLRHASV
jgi:cyclic peptide transporter